MVQKRNFRSAVIFIYMQMQDDGDHLEVLYNQFTSPYKANPQISLVVRE